VKKPKVFIFDEASPALDFKTDQQLRAALRHEIRGATVIIVAQRVGTILHADQIIVPRRPNCGHRNPRRIDEDLRHVFKRSCTRS